MSLYRLIRLAKKTGDRLIVHNETDNSNIVIMDLDNYERLVDFSDPDDFGGDFGGVPPWDPTPNPWSNSANTDTTYPWEDDEDEPEYGSDEWFRVHGHPKEENWSSVGDLMGERYTSMYEEDESTHISADDTHDVIPFTPEDTNDMVSAVTQEITVEPTVEPIPEPVLPLEAHEEEQMIVLADEPMQNSDDTSSVDQFRVPAPSDDVVSTEESLSDGPVFYEEPT